MADKFDSALIDEMDPSLDGGVYHVIYQREVPLEIRHLPSEEDQSNRGIFEPVWVKVLISGQQACPSIVRVELSSECDLFFQYVHSIELSKYQEIQESQNLMVEFPDYPAVIIRMLNSCIREPNMYFGVFSMSPSLREAKIEFIQNVEYKYISLMNCDFFRASEEIVQSQITYRYNAMKQRLSVLHSRLFEVNSLIKAKNPSLLLQLNKLTNDGNNLSFGSEEGNSSSRVW